MDMDFATIGKIHFVGIKGIAMTALALWAKERGMTVTGSDVSEEFPSDSLLKKAGITPFVGFDPSHISRDRPNLVVYTGAHSGRANAEVVAAEAMEIPTLAHGKALGMVMAPSRQISVAGSHGKTTTSAMISLILMHAGLDASYAIGSGEIRGLGLPGHAGKGEFFVAEADEYVTDPTHDATPRFLWQHPEILVVTNIDYDHPDVYPSLTEVQQAFVKLQANQPKGGVAIINADDPASQVLLTSPSYKTVTYGRSKNASYRIIDEVVGVGKNSFSLEHEGKRVASFALMVPGAHNITNAAAAVVAATHAGVSWEKTVSALVSFGGAKRRFEKIGEKGDIIFYDDYAHHPKEIAMTLKATRSWYPKHTIIAVFQPHTYSRTKALLGEFGRAFTDADEVLCTDIYASARETDMHEISGDALYKEMKRHHPSVFYMPDEHAIVRALGGKKGPAVIVFMGAGSIYSWEADMLQKLIKGEQS